MDLKNLSKIGDSIPAPKEESALEPSNDALKRLFKNKRVADTSSVLPSLAKDRKAWIESKKKSIVSALSLEQEESAIVSKVIDSMAEAYSKKLTISLDTVNNLKAIIVERKVDLDKWKKAYDSLKLEIKKYKQQIADSAESIKTLEFRVKDSEGNYQNIRARVAEIIEDAEYVLTTKEEQEKRAAEEQRKREELEKQLEEERKQREQSQKTVQINDTFDENLAESFSKSFEDFIQTGSAFTAEKLRSLADQIGDPKITELVSRVTEYEPLEQDAYEELALPVKEELANFGQSIPSLPLIQDSAHLKTVKDSNEIPVPSDEFRKMLKDVYDYVLFPSDEKRKSLASTLEVLSSWGPAKDIAVSIDSPEALNEVQGMINEANSHGVVLDPVQAPVAECVQCEEPAIAANEVLTKEQFQDVYDSVSVLNRVRRIATRIHDCADIKVDKVNPEDIYASPCGKYIIIKINGKEVPFTFRYNNDLNIDQKVVDLKHAAVEPSQVQRIIWNELIPVEVITETAVEVEELPVVTDSLYKRCLKDQFYVTEVIDSVEGLVKTLKSLRPIIGDHCIRSIYDSVSYPCMLGVTSSKFSANITEMKVKETKDFITDSKKFTVRLFL